MADALLIPLSELPGFDAVGLVLHFADHGRAVCIDDSGGDVLVAWSADDDGREWVERPRARVSTADSATRDRLARWVAGRRDLTAWEGLLWGQTERGERSWSLRGWMRFRVFLAATVPALASLNPSSGELLSDGSRWVDAAALAAVARHVGREVQP